MAWISHSRAIDNAISGSRNCGPTAFRQYISVHWSERSSTRSYLKWGDEKTNKRKEFPGIVSGMGGVTKFVCVLPFSCAKRETHKTKFQQGISGKCRDSPGIIPRNFVSAFPCLLCFIPALIKARERRRMLKHQHKDGPKTLQRLWRRYVNGFCKSAKPCDPDSLVQPSNSWIARSSK